MLSGKRPDSIFVLVGLLSKPF